MKQKWKNPGGGFNHIYIKNIKFVYVWKKLSSLKRQSGETKLNKTNKKKKSGGTIIKVLNIDHFPNGLDTAVSWKHSWVSTIIVNCVTLLHQWGHPLKTSVTEQKYWAVTFSESWIVQLRCLVIKCHDNPSGLENVASSCQLTKLLQQQLKANILELPASKKIFLKGQIVIIEQKKGSS